MNEATRKRKLGRLLALATVAVALTAFTMTPTRAAPAATAAAGDPLPNILLIVTDDQPKGTIDAMPSLLNRVRDKGVTFSNGVLPTSLCCPSRSSLLTGNYAHTTGVYTNEPEHGSWTVFHDGGAEDTTLATQLDAAGYNTGLFGKYLNGYQAKGWNNGITPKGWDTFRAMLPNKGGDGAYYNYEITGFDNQYGVAPRDYSTDVFGDLAVEHITSTPADTPWFAYYAPYASHGPIRPAPRHQNTWPLEPASAIPALNEANVSDKPDWIKDNPLVDERSARVSLTRQHESLMAVDENLDAMLDAADLSNTLVVYMSDNGFMLGSHRILGKNVPHTRSSEVPMFVRWDGVVAPGTTDDRVTPQIDLTAMIRDAAGIPNWEMDGRNAITTSRVGLVMEQTDNSTANTAPDRWRPSYCGWRTKRYLYVEYDAGQGREFYDYEKDPHELTNAIRDDDYAARIARHRQRAEAACSPSPPGFDW